MDYIVQIENFFKFLKLNTDNEKKLQILKFKKLFYNDFNLIGSFLKDFLFIQNSDIFSKDEELYENFMLEYLSLKEKEKEEFLNNLFRYAKYYQMIAFENTEDKILLNCISTINSFYALYSYPYLMIIINDYLNQKIDGKTYNMMLTSLIDIVIKMSQKTDYYVLTPIDIKSEMEVLLNKKERLAS